MRKLSLIVALLCCVFSVWAQSPHGDNLTISCDDCHQTTGWTMKPGTYTFDHNVATQFTLVGQHSALDCKSCHSTLVFDQAKPECVSCHTDMHNQTVGMDCALCHTSQSWLVPNITEIHQMSRFPLMGAHLTADCNDCHPSASLLSFEPLGIECIDCHQTDYNQTQNPNHVTAGYSTNCTECHYMNMFTWSGAGIDHSFFPLTQGHAIGDCFQCHTQGTDYSNISSDCFSCHEQDYQATSNPNHSAIGLSLTCNECHTTIPGWKPADFNQHDAQFFPIYSGEHNGEWVSCTDCHQNPANYAQFTCIDCHEHNKPDMDDEHSDVGGYLYESQACFDCHPTGSGEGGFNHNLSAFPLTGAHTSVECSDCHVNGYSGTSTVCYDCHEVAFTQTSNPPHNAIGITTDCDLCHTTLPEWKPATFPIHDNYYTLTGAHGRISTDCFACHEGSYVNTPNLCFSCHSNDYNQTTDPPHQAAQFSTECETCHATEAWQPATFDHDEQYFPIYSGEHQGEWNSCTECHTNPASYAIFSCIDCHEHNQTDMNDEHGGIPGYEYASEACFACHPTGSAEGGFNHNATNFPLTGAHNTTECSACHQNGYAGTTMICGDCHQTDYGQTSNPNHNALGITNECEDCHTTNPGWIPATFSIHDQYYLLAGAHIGIANNCAECHSGDYNSTPNTCYGCHQNDYNQTNDPPHASAQFPTDCESCHTQSVWEPSTFNHDGQYFPIYSGDHRNEWTSCADCHTNPSNYASFSCIDCHEHNQTDMNDEHQGVSGYQYNSDACFNCHPNGSSARIFPKRYND